MKEKYYFKILLICFVTVGFVFALNLDVAADIDDGLVAYYPFNGNANDLSGNGNNGIVNGATLASDRDGNPNSAYSFDGEDDYIDVGNYPLSYDYATVSLWVKTDKGTDNYAAFDWNTEDNAGGIDISVGLVTQGDLPNVFSGAFRDELWTTGLYPRYWGTSKIADNQWHHVAFVYDGDFYLYVDGNLETSIERNSTLSNQDQSIHIGHLVNHPVGSYHFSGVIDDIRLYKRGLSAEEIQKLYEYTPTCPSEPEDYTVELFADVPNPFHLAFDSRGSLFVGRSDATARIIRVSPNGSTVVEFGDLIDDPDGVIVDTMGSVASLGSESVLVAGALGNGVSRLTEISPDGSLTKSLVDGTTPEINNPQQFAFDVSGKLLFVNCNSISEASTGTVGYFDGSTLGVFGTVDVNTCLGGIAIGPDGRVFVSDFYNGDIKILKAAGDLLDAAFVTGLSSPDAMAFDLIGEFDNQLFVTERGTNQILRIDPDTGTTKVFVTCIDDPFGLAFGPDGCLYASENGQDKVWRICKKCSFAYVYGEYSEEVDILRHFRDNVLSKSHEGQELIKLYYQWSPVIVEAMQDDEGFKEEVKEMFDGVIELITEEK